MYNSIQFNIIYIELKNNHNSPKVLSLKHKMIKTADSKGAFLIWRGNLFQKEIEKALCTSK